MFVVDEQDDKVYTCNLPDAIIAQLVSLSLTEIDIGEFSKHRQSYPPIAKQALSVTTVLAEASQEEAIVEVEPADADLDPEKGWQVALSAETTVALTVKSADGSRTRRYRFQVSKPMCLEGLTEQRLSTVNFAGGSVSELAACARRHGVNALYHHREGIWTALFLIPEAPEFLSRAFRDRFPDRLPAGEPLIAHRPVAAPSTPATPNQN